MPTIQWLGDIPKENAGSYTAKAIGEGISGAFKGYAYQKEKNRETALKERELGIQESEAAIRAKILEKDYAKLDYDKRKDAYDTMVKLLPNLPPEKQTELTSSPEWTTLEKSLGMPSLAGSTMSSVKEPSWKQEQEVASIKADIVRGQGSISTLVGEPLPMELKDEASVLDYISKRGYDPALFSGEIAARFGTGAPSVVKKNVNVRQASPYKEYPDAYQEGSVWKVRRGGKVYRIQD